MNYDEIAFKFVHEHGAEISTMMGTPCLRYKGQFIAMMFDKEDALIIKVSEKSVNELIDREIGREFNFTKKRFKEWVLIPMKFHNEYEAHILAALNYAKERIKK